MSDDPLLQSEPNEPNQLIWNHHLLTWNNRNTMLPAFFPNARQWRAHNNLGWILTIPDQGQPPFSIRHQILMSGATTAAPPATGTSSATAEVEPGTAVSCSEAPAPTQARFLLERFLPRADRNAIRGDIEEEFNTRLAKDGPTYARRWFWRETVWTIVQHNPIVRSVLTNGLMRLGEWIFRQFGT